MAQGQVRCTVWTAQPEKYEIIRKAVACDNGMKQQRGQGCKEQCANSS